MELEEIKSIVEAKFKNPLPSHIFLDSMRVIDEESRKSYAYNNSTYIPFYYWLGTLIKPESLIEIGFGLGLLSGNFLKSCKTVKNFYAVQEIKQGYSLRLGKHNVRDNYKGELYLHFGSLTDDVFEAKFRSVEFGLGIINEESSYDRHRYYLDYLWPQISDGGLIVMDYLKRHRLSDSAFKDFCLSKNLKPTYINTTYGVGLIRKEQRGI